MHEWFWTTPGLRNEVQLLARRHCLLSPLLHVTAIQDGFTHSDKVWSAESAVRSYRIALMTALCYSAVHSAV